MKPRRSILEVHASDNDQCLARLRAEFDGAGRDVRLHEAAGVGSAVHYCAEKVAAHTAEFPLADIRKVAADGLKEAVRKWNLSPAAAMDAAAILEQTLGDRSRIELTVRPGWSGRPEQRWALVGDGDDFVAADPDGEGPFVAAGTIDLLEWSGSSAVVTDYKTKRVMLGAEDAWEDWQLRLYAFATLRMFPEVETVTGRFAMLRHGYYATAEFRRGDPWEWGVLQRISALHLARVEAEEKNLWPETLGPWCAYCPRLGKCGTLRRAEDEGALVVSRGDPLPEITRRYLALKRVVGQLEDHVRAQIDESGQCVPLGDAKGSVYGPKPTEGIEVLQGYEDTMRLLRSYGMTEALEVEHFRYCQQNHFPGRVKKVLEELRVRPNVPEWDNLLAPVTNFTVKTWRPDPEVEPDPTVTLDELDEMIDERMI